VIVCTIFCDGAVIFIQVKNNEWKVPVADMQGKGRDRWIGGGHRLCLDMRLASEAKSLGAGYVEVMGLTNEVNDCGDNKDTQYK
jgi:hypothetical protein